MTDIDTTDVQLINDKQLAKLLTISTGHVWVMRRNDQQFPKPLKLAPKLVRWRLSDVKAYLDTLAASNTDMDKAA